MTSSMEAKKGWTIGIFYAVLPIPGLIWHFKASSAIFCSSKKIEKSQGTVNWSWDDEESPKYKIIDNLHENTSHLKSHEIHKSQDQRADYDRIEHKECYLDKNKNNLLFNQFMNLRLE